MFQPTHSLVTVILLKKTKTAGGISLPESFADILVQARVRAVGPAAYREDSLGDFTPTVRVGDLVLIGQHVQQGPGGQRRVVPFPDFQDSDGETVTLLDHSEILGIIDRPQLTITKTDETGADPHAPK